MDNAKRIMRLPENIGAVDHTHLARVALRQNGLFTRSQARACGYTPFQIRRRLAQGEWQLWFETVLAPAGLRLTPSIRDRAAQLAVPGSVLAGPSAARLWGIKTASVGTYLLVGRRVWTSWPDVTVRQEVVARRDVNVVNGMAATSLERTVFDCLRLLPAAPAAAVLDRALQEGWTTIESLTTRLHRLTGRHGLGPVRRLVQAAADGSRSAAERALAKLVRQAGIPGWALNVPIRDGAGLIGVGDVVFADQKLVLEMDGHAHHAAGRAFQRDRTRQNRLINAGWRVLRFTWHDVMHRPEHVISTIRAALLRA